MIDLKKFIEKKEEINGIYQKVLNEMQVSKENQETFFSKIDELFKDKVKTTEKDHVLLYKQIAYNVFLVLKKTRRNYFSKLNKKLLKNRGNVFWDSRKGTYRK